MSNNVGLQEENRIGNITLNGTFDALSLYTDYMVYNHIDGERVYEIVDWEVTDIEGANKDMFMVGWVGDQMLGVGDYIDITASSKSTIHFEDAEGVVYTVELELEKLN
jgi:hypothetical protein